METFVIRLVTKSNQTSKQFTSSNKWRDWPLIGLKSRIECLGIFQVLCALSSHFADVKFMFKLSRAYNSVPTINGCFVELQEALSAYLSYFPLPVVF